MIIEDTSDDEEVVSPEDLNESILYFANNTTINYVRREPEDGRLVTSRFFKIDPKLCMSKLEKVFALIKVKLNEETKYLLYGNDKSGNMNEYTEEEKDKLVVVKGSNA